MLTVMAKFLSRFIFCRKTEISQTKDTNGYNSKGESKVLFVGDLSSINIMDFSKV